MVANPPKSDLELAFYSPDGDYRFYGGSVDSEYAFLLEAYDLGITATGLLSGAGGQEFLDAPTTNYVNHDLNNELGVCRNGSFQPLSTTVDLTVEIALSNTGFVNCNPIVWYGQPVVPGTLLFDKNNSGLLGSTFKSLGTIGIDRSGSVQATFRLTGLDKSKRVTYQVQPLLIGGNQFLPVGTTPIAVTVTPDGKKLFVANFGSGDVTAYITGGWPNWSVLGGTGQDSVSSASIVTAAGPLDIASNDVKVVVANYTANSVSIIDRTSNAVLFTTALPGGFKPWSVAIQPDGVTAWLGGELGTVIPVTIATGVVGAQLPVGGAADFIKGIGMVPNGSGFYVSNFTTGKVRAVTTPGLVVAPEINVGGNPTKVRIIENTHAWVICQTTNRIKSILFATQLVESDYALSISPVDFALVPRAVGETPYTASIGGTGGNWQQFCLQGQFAGAQQLNQFTTPADGNINGTCADKYGNLWLCHGALARVQKFPCGEVNIRPLPVGFFGEFVRIKAVPAST